MKKVILMIAIVFMASTSASAQFMNTGSGNMSQSTNQPVQHTSSEKSPALAGLLSFVLPGAGQFYNGESKKGWNDLGWQLGGYLVTSIGAGLAYSSPEVGAVLVSCGGLFMLVNGIGSIVDAVKSAKRINLENGYMAIDLGNGSSIGLAPAITYEHPEYAMGMQNEFSAGMKMSISF